MDVPKLKYWGKNKKKTMTQDFQTGGKGNQALNMLDILRDMPIEVKNLVVFPSIKRLDLCIRAFVKTNCNKQSFVDQRKSAGLNCVKYFDKVIGKGSITRSIE